MKAKVDELEKGVGSDEKGQIKRRIDYRIDIKKNREAVT